jgi:hypothetical protein
VHSSLESRRTTHKAAEQKRRDSLKQSFDELKKVVPYQSISGKSDGNINNNSKSNGNGKSGDGTMKNVSKLFLLKRGKLKKNEMFDLKFSMLIKYFLFIE